MAEHVVSVTIRAQVQQYLQGMQQIAQATQQANTAQQNLQAQGEGMKKVGEGLLKIGAAAGLAVSLTVKAFADFDAQMSQVQSLSHATATEMDTLRNAALTMGQGIGFSATQVAEAETELVKAGVSVKDIMGGALKGALDLAAAGQLEVGRATEIASTALTQFGLSGKDVPHVADLLAAAADKSLGGVEQLGQALQQSGLVANQFGLSIDETVGTLAEFASNGLLGSDAGTSFKSMLLQLATPSKQAAAAMAEYNIQAYDAQGNFVGITGLAGQLASGFKGVDSASRDAALGIIFGSDAIRAANILYKDGADGNQKWINSVNEAGFAAQQAAGKTDNLNGDIKKLGAALESGLIRTGSASNGVLRGMVQNLTAAAKAYGDAPSWLQGTALGLTAVVAATALAGGGFLTMVPKIAAARAAMTQMNLTAGKIARGFGAGGVALLGIAAFSSGLANLGSEAQLTDGQIRKLNGSLAGGGIKSLNKQFVGGGSVGFDAISSSVTTARGALNALDKDAANINFAKFTDGLTFGLLKTSDTAKRFEAQFKQMGTVLATTAESDVTSAAQGFNQLVKQMGGGQDTAKKLLDRMSPYKDQLSALASEAGKTASEQDLLNLAQGKGKLAAQLAAESAQGQKEKLAELTGVASEAKQEIGELADSIRDFGSTQLSVESTESDFQQAIDDATQALKDNGKQLTENGDAIDLNSEKGRANAAALRQIAQDGVAATAAIAENGGTQEQAAAKMQTTREAYVNAAEAFGLSRDQARAMADQLKLIPENVSTLFAEQGADDVSGKAKDVKANVDRVPKSKVTQLKGDLSDAKAKLAELEAKLATVPKSKSTQLNAEVAAAKANVASLQAQINGVQSKTITITTNRVETATKQNTKGIFKADGGYISGPGTGTSDSIPAMLSNGEYVVRAASVDKYGTGFLDRVNAGHYANGGLVHLASGGSAAAAQKAAQKAAEAAAKARADAAKKRADAREKAEAARLARQTDIYQFRTSMRTGSLTGMSAVQGAFGIATDSKYPERYRNAVARIADRSEKAMIKLEKRSDRAAAAVEKASDKLKDLRGSASSMSSSISGKLSDFSYGDYRSSTSLLRGLTSRASKLKQFQALLVTLRKNGLAPALLNEVASLGVDEGLPLAKSLAASSKSQIAAINSQYGSIGKTSTQIGNQVADANFGKLITAAEKQLRAANKNASSITRAISTESRRLQRLIGKALGVPGYQVGGYTGDGAPGQVAGLVHGREFVMNAYATAANRPLLEAMNQGGNVRYMDPTRIVQAAPAAGNTYEQKNYITPVQGVDPNTVTTVLGRELSRQFAGMVS